MDKPLNFENINTNTIRDIMSELVDLLNKDPDKNHYLNSFEMQTNHLPEYIKTYIDNNDRLIDLDFLFVRKLCFFLLQLSLNGDDNVTEYLDESYTEVFIFHFIHDGIIVGVSISKNSDHFNIHLVNHNTGKHFRNVNYNLPLQTLDTIIRKNIVKDYIKRTYIRE